MGKRRMLRTVVVLAVLFVVLCGIRAAKDEWTAGEGHTPGREQADGRQQGGSTGAAGSKPQGDSAENTDGDRTENTEPAGGKPQEAGTEDTRPRRRTKEEALERLEELGKEYPAIQDIRENSAAYPEELLAALANNPEMADFVSGYGTDGERPACALSTEEMEQEFPLFLQWDSRWGYQSYGKDSCIGTAGCGPTCMSMVLYYLTKDRTLTPDSLAAYAMDNGYYASGLGTSWTYMDDVPLLYGISVKEVMLMERAMKAELDRGAVIICSMGAGDFTAAGHFIVIYGYTDNGFQVNDPNCVARSRQVWTYGQIEHQIKKIWSYWKEE